MQVLVEKVLGKLEDLQTNKVFLMLKMQLLKIIKENGVNDNDIKIILDSSFKDADLSNQGKVIFSSSDKGHKITIDIDAGDYNYMFEVFEDNITLSGYTYDEEFLMHYESYIYDMTKRRLTIIKDIMDRNDYYLDYQIDIYALDRNGNILKQDMEEEKDKCFSETFAVPLDKIREYRTSFSQYYREINESKIKSEMAKDDNPYLFTSPFSLVDFEHIFMYGVESEEGLLGAIEYGYTLEDLEIAMRRLDELKQSLIRQIGNEGEIILSDNLYENIARYIFNSSSEFLLTTGTIVKKYRDEYSLYCLEMQADKLMIMGKAISIDEARDIYNQNEANKEVEGLQEFFQVTRNR